MLPWTKYDKNAKIWCLANLNINLSQALLNPNEVTEIWFCLKNRVPGIVLHFVDGHRLWWDHLQKN